MDFSVNRQPAGGNPFSARRAHAELAQDIDREERAAALQDPGAGRSR
jgi:hypothetical protein